MPIGCASHHARAPTQSRTALCSLTCTSHAGTRSCGARQHGHRGASQSNLQYIGAARTQLRADLVAATRTRKLPYCDGPLLDVFAEAAGSCEATSEELEVLDVS